MADKLNTSLDLPALSSAPANPGSGYMRFYGKTDGKPYAKNSSGTEYDLSATGGGGGATELTINSQTGTSYTLATTDASNTLIRMNNAAAITLNLPLNSNVAIAIGSVISVEQQGAGIITVTPLSTVTVNTTARKTWGQNAVIQLIKVGENVWNVINGTV
jgi:hypothetical protein